MSDPEIGHGDAPLRTDRGSPARLAAIVVPIVLLAALIGFGWALGWHQPLLEAFKPGLAPARGRVMYNGKPLERGHVEAWPTSGSGDAALGGINPDGTFEFATQGKPGAAIGENRFVVMAMTSGFPPELMVPARYTKAATTPLHGTVTADPSKNVFELELTDE